VNTVEDETSISLIGRGDSALITSWDAESGRAGIYQVVLDPDQRPSPYASFINEVRDALTNALVSNVDVVVVDSANPDACAQMYRTDLQNGSSRMPLAQNGRYIVTTKAPGYVPHRQVIGVHQLDSTVELRVTTKLFNGRQPLASVYFERGSFAISPEQQEKLRAAMTSYDVHQIRFEVTGYADPLGTVPKNKTLSQQRADAVRHALSTLGVDEARIVASGMGIEKLSTQPVIADEERPESRRVDIYPAP
jgi:outer membrane protein OmpA-like peptidoglycan-associated protein